MRFPCSPAMDEEEIRVLAVPWGAIVCTVYRSMGFFLISEDGGREQAGLSHFCAMVAGHYKSQSLRRLNPPPKPLSLKDRDGVQGKEGQEMEIQFS